MTEEKETKDKPKRPSWPIDQRAGDMEKERKRKRIKRIIDRM